MGDRTEDKEHQVVVGRRRSVALGEADQVDVVGLEVFDRFEELFDGVPKGVEADDAEAVAGVCVVEQLRQWQGLDRLLVLRA